MTTDAPTHPTAEGITERFDPIDCLDERIRSQPQPDGALDPGRYLVVHGPARAITISLEDEVVHIGRGLGADLRFDDVSVSRRHAIVDPQPDGTRILDDRSSNGTLVNGVAVTDADLRHGDLITVGRVELRYIEVPPAPSL